MAEPLAKAKAVAAMALKLYSTVKMRRALAVQVAIKVEPQILCRCSIISKYAY
jgi:hypothetical protein